MEVDLCSSQLLHIPLNLCVLFPNFTLLDTVSNWLSYTGASESPFLYAETCVSQILLFHEASYNYSQYWHVRSCVALILCSLCVHLCEHRAMSFMVACGFGNRELVLNYRMSHYNAISSLGCAFSKTLCLMRAMLSRVQGLLLSISPSLETWGLFIYNAVIYCRVFYHIGPHFSMLE